MARKGGTAVHMEEGSWLVEHVAVFRSTCMLEGWIQMEGKEETKTQKLEGGVGYCRSEVPEWPKGLGSGVYTAGLAARGVGKTCPLHGRSLLKARLDNGGLRDKKDE